MGLPQVPPSVTDEVTALSTFVSIPPRFGGIVNRDLDGLHVGSTSRTSSDFSCSSVTDFQRKTTLELPKVTDGLFKCKSANDGPANFHGLKIDCKDKRGWIVPRAGEDAHRPVMRIVGFESGHRVSVIGSGKVISDETHSDVASDNANGPLVRKRMLSPLNSMLRKHFHGEVLNLADSDHPVDSDENVRGESLSSSNDCMKASISRLSDWNSVLMNNRISSGLFIDGPLLDNKEAYSLFPSSTSRGLDNKTDTSGLQTPGKIAMLHQVINSPPLSLSPLGPRWSERRNVVGTSRNIVVAENEFPGFNDSSLAYGNSLGDTLLSKHKFGNMNNLYDEFVSHEHTLWDSQESFPTHCIKSVKNLNILPVRRSLVGSFEESLLSGRFSSGKVSQRIDGFLAVLNVTGGNFSPQSQKLPFAVTSVDGNSSLLYYASINLASNSPSNECKSPKFKRSLSNDDAHSVKNRLRIPVKGCIQLVLSNPERTPVHTFFCNYDLSDMPPGTKVQESHGSSVNMQTFMRQKATLATSSSPLQSVKDGLRSQDTLLPLKSEGSLTTDFVQHSVLMSESQNSGGVNTMPLSSIKSCEQQSCFGPCMNNGNDASRDGDVTNPKPSNSSVKVNDNMSGTAALRYALHLRFLCPLSRKCCKAVQRCKSDPFSVPHINNKDLEAERRFYLYNDLRVVFPQRHSDADEGKITLEHHFPADPKYFDVSS